MGMTISEKITSTITKAALFGAATGDAFGISVEFKSRDEVRAINPKDMLERYADEFAKAICA